MKKTTKTYYFELRRPIQNVDEPHLSDFTTLSDRVQAENLIEAYAAVQKICEDINKTAASQYTVYNVCNEN